MDGSGGAQPLGEDDDADLESFVSLMRAFTRVVRDANPGSPYTVSAAALGRREHPEPTAAALGALGDRLGSVKSGVFRSARQAPVSSGTTVQRLYEDVAGPAV